MRAAAAEVSGYPEEEGITYAVLKGRSNFLCVRRHQDTLRAGTILDTDLISNLDLWAAETETGDREDLTFRVPVGPWMEIASDGEDCSPRLCTFREGCFYYAHRDRAGKADLVVVNHSLLLANAAAGGAIFDTEGAHLVMDEARRLEEVMAETFGARVSYGRVRYVMRQAKKRCESAVAAAERAETAAELFFEDLGSGTSVLHESPPRSYDTLVGALISVRSALASDPREEVNALQGMVGRLRRDLVSFYFKPDEDYAYAVVAGWSRRGGGRGYPELKSWLVETAEVFRENVLPLFESGGVVLTSATLATSSGPRRSFGYVRRRLGLDEGGVGGGVEEFAGEEVFDYENRCLVYVEEEIAPPNLGSPDLFARSCALRTEELVGLSGGQALVLLSTNRALAAFRESFRPPYPVCYQGDDSPGRLVRWLKETEGAILVGTRTFWEGVDIPGASVSLVVMDRVPFAPPDDPVAAKLREKAGERAFREVFLPKAQVAVRQGAGRLMRRATDRGVVALLDPRVARKGWGKAVLASLPPARRTGSLAEVARFFAADSGLEGR
jgi:ATP-dependent DNA helicase DinG